jgi:hypothetical protein
MPTSHAPLDRSAFSLSRCPKIRSRRNLRRRHTLRAAELHEADYSPWEGRDLAAWPSMTMLRGKIVVEGGAFTGDPKDGHFLLRKIPEEIRTRPMV